MTAVQNSNKFS